MDSWWAPREVAVGDTWTAVVGSCELVIEHAAHEWRVGATPSHRPIAPASLRLATSSQSDGIRLHPRLADRPVVARLEVPLTIPDGDHATIYVGSPLWAEVELAPPSKVRAGELRLFDPPNTWFGPNTKVGELCYASRTQGRLVEAAIVHQGDRAITTVIVDNASGSPLVFTRVRIPVPQLSLYVASDGTLWTNDVLVRNDGGNQTEEVADGPPADPADPSISASRGALTELARPREVPQRTILARAIGALL